MDPQQQLQACLQPIATRAANALCWVCRNRSGVLRRVGLVSSRRRSRVRKVRKGRRRLRPASQAERVGLAAAPLAARACHSRNCGSSGSPGSSQVGEERVVDGVEHDEAHSADSRHDTHDCAAHAPGREGQGERGVRKEARQNVVVTGCPVAGRGCMCSTGRAQQPASDAATLAACRSQA